MSLARAWTRQLYGAWGVALIAPATMIIVLIVLALTGGFGGLSALGQLVSGPAVPVAAGGPGGRVAGTATAVLPEVPAAVPASGAPTRLAAVSTGATHTGSAPGVHSGSNGSVPRSGTGQRVGSGGHGATAPVTTVQPPPAHPSPPVSSPTPPAAPVPALVNQVVAVGVSVTSKLPGPLAAIGTGALESVGQTLNTLLAPQP